MSIFKILYMRAHHAHYLTPFMCIKASKTFFPRKETAPTFFRSPVSNQRESTKLLRYMEASERAHERKWSLILIRARKSRKQPTKGKKRKVSKRERSFFFSSFFFWWQQHQQLPKWTLRPHQQLLPPRLQQSHHHHQHLQHQSPVRPGGWRICCPGCPSGAAAGGTPTRRERRSSRDGRWGSMMDFKKRRYTECSSATMEWSNG